MAMVYFKADKYKKMKCYLVNDTGILGLKKKDLKSKFSQQELNLSSN